MAGWGTFLAAAVSPLARRALVSVGVGTLTYAGFDSAVSGLLSSAESAFVGLSGAAGQLVLLSGVGTAASIIAGAIVARVSMMALKRLGVVAG
jgi:hypothetical protein